jgi:hypothetical protein
VDGPSIASYSTHCLSAVHTGRHSCPQDPRQMEPADEKLAISMGAWRKRKGSRSRKRVSAGVRFRRWERSEKWEKRGGMGWDGEKRERGIGLTRWSVVVLQYRMRLALASLTRIRGRPRSSRSR